MVVLYVVRMKLTWCLTTQATLNVKLNEVCKWYGKAGSWCSSVLKVDSYETVFYVCTYNNEKVGHYHDHKNHKMRESKLPKHFFSLSI